MVDRDPVNWGLIGLVGLSVEFWAVLVIVVLLHVM